METRPVGMKHTTDGDFLRPYVVATVLLLSHLPDYLTDVIRDFESLVNHYLRG